MNDANLDNLYIAAACDADWNDMKGDDRVRACSLCSKNVYNISDMTKSEAEQFLSKHGVSVCMRLARRADGTIITDDCPVGLRKLRDFGRKMSRIAATVVGFMVSATFSAGTAAKANPQSGNATKSPTTKVEPIMMPMGVPAYNPEERSRLNQDPLSVIVERDAAASESVLLAEYVGYESNGTITYDHPPQAKFKLVKVLKGTAAPEDLVVRYDFADTQVTTAPAAGWTFSESLMPKQGAQYVLFLSKSTPEGGVYKTYRGGGGRMEMCEKLNKAIEAVQTKGGFGSASTTKGSAKP